MVLTCINTPKISGRTGYNVVVDLPQGKHQSIGLVTPQLMVVKVHYIRKIQLLGEAMIWTDLAS